jgi:hypothetical protein
MPRAIFIVVRAYTSQPSAHHHFHSMIQIVPARRRICLLRVPAQPQTYLTAFPLLTLQHAALPRRIAQPGHLIIMQAITVPDLPLGQIQALLRLVQRDQIDIEERVHFTLDLVRALSLSISTARHNSRPTSPLRPPSGSEVKPPRNATPTQLTSRHKWTPQSRQNQR